MESDEAFTSNYETARSRFREVAAEAGADPDGWNISGRGPEGEILSTDIAWLGPRPPRRILIHTSGLHGVEGFAGSAIQFCLLRDPPTLPDDTALVLLHALNPFGMAWLRRGNESNVDLNRNVILAGRPVPATPPAYHRLDQLLNPKSPPGPDHFRLRALWAIARYGFATLKQAIPAGQRDYPQGLFYRGRRMEEEMRSYRAWLDACCADVERFFVVDVHTGLGRYGEATCIRSPSGTNAAPLELDGQRVMPDGDAAVLGYEVTGGHVDLYADLFPGRPVDFITQEFGTVSGLRILQALRSENRHHHYGNGSVDHQAKIGLRDCFNPPDARWQRKVVQQGRELVRAGLEYLNEQ